MPFAVSQWPYAPDPRLPSFDLFGFDYGQVPSWAWTMSTTNATGLAAVFNAGVVVKPTIILPGQVTFANVDTLPDNVTVTVKHSGFLEPFGPSFDKTLFMTPIVRQSGSPEFSGVEGWLYPTAIAVFEVPTMVKVGIGIGTMPDKVTLTPEIWDI